MIKTHPLLLMKTTTLDLSHCQACSFLNLQSLLYPFFLHDPSCSLTSCSYCQHLFFIMPLTTPSVFFFSSCWHQFQHYNSINLPLWHWWKHIVKQIAPPFNDLFQVLGNLICFIYLFSPFDINGKGYKAPPINMVLLFVSLPYQTLHLFFVTTPPITFAAANSSFFFTYTPNFFPRFSITIFVQLLCLLSTLFLISGWINTFSPLEIQFGKVECHGKLWCYVWDCFKSLSNLLHHLFKLVTYLTSLLKVLLILFS